MATHQVGLLPLSLSVLFFLPLSISLWVAIYQISQDRRSAKQSLLCSLGLTLS